MAKQVDYLKKLQDEFDMFTSDLTEELKVIPTGSISLDVSTEIGGIPIGRSTMIYGPFSSAKTTLCLNIAKSALDLDYEVAYVDAENTMDGSYVEKILGVVPDEKFILYQPDTAENALTICEYLIRSGKYGLVILDSIGALAPEEELKKELKENSMTLVPRLLSKFLRRNTFLIKKNNVAFVLVNQVRANMKSYYGGYDVPGGNALKHFTVLWISLSKGTVIKQGEEDIGIYSSFVIKKNKLGRPFRAHSFPVIFGEGIDKTWNLIEFSEMLGVLQKKGSFYSFEGSTLGQGVLKTKLFLEENPEILDKVRKLCYTLVNKIPIEKGEVEDET